ncbi:Pachytene checkpoint protein 2, partial [Halocaridina rubra]
MIEKFPTVRTGSIIKQEALKSPLADHVKYIKICELDSSAGIKHLETSSVYIEYYVYKLECDGPGIEELEEGGEELPAATHWTLPAVEFEDLWENLIYDTPVKEQ